MNDTVLKTENLTRYYDVILGRSFQASIGVHF